MLRPTAIWLWDDSAGSYVNLTSNIATNTDFNFIADANDKIYVGSNRRSIGLYCDLTTNGSYTSLTYTYTTNGDTWGNLNLIDSYSFSASKYFRWVLPDSWIKFNFTSTNPHSATPPDTVERYWVRIACSAVTTTAVINKLRLIPFAEYCTPTDVSRFCSFKKDFDNSTNPSDLTVEDRIREAEDIIDYRTRKSFRFNVVTNEVGQPTFVDFNRYGFYLRYKDFIKVYSLRLWNGATWDTMTEGRTQDFWVDHNLGMIYFARMYLLPSVYGMVGRYSAYNFGEFKGSVSVDYAWGKDPEQDRQFYIFKKLAIDMASVDIVRHHDYSSMIVSGSDKVSLESKIANLEQNIEMRLDELTGVFMI